MDEDHALSEFLSRRLTEVGLDPDTYGPYVLPLLVEADTEVDEEEWDGVMELLRASSESHSDDDEQTWIDLRRDIQLAWKQHNDKVNDEARKQKIENERRIQKEIERDRQIAKEAAELKEAEREKGEEGGASNTATTNTINAGDADADDEAHRRALVARFGYENDEDDNNGGEGGEQQVIITNQQAAAQLKQDQIESMRAKKHGGTTTTKKEEQQKTAQSRKDKANLKEERRKRATKGERRR